MKFTAIAFDLDGTLLSSNEQIFAENISIIKTLEQRGVTPLLVTGRHHTAVRPFYARLNLTTPVICCNGTYVYDFINDKVLQHTTLDHHSARMILQWAQEHNIHTALYTQDAMVFQELNAHFKRLMLWANTIEPSLRPRIYQVADLSSLLDHKTVVWKILLSDADTQKLHHFVQKLPLDVTSEWSWSNRIDVTPAGNSKGSRLREVLAEHNILPEQTIAFGDNHNDISMFEVVGLPIAMGESEMAVAQKAKRVIGSHNRPSIAETLSEIFAL